MQAGGTGSARDASTHGAMLLAHTFACLHRKIQ